MGLLLFSDMIAVSARQLLNWNTNMKFPCPRSVILSELYLWQLSMALFFYFIRFILFYFFQTAISSVLNTQEGSQCCVLYCIPPNCLLLSALPYVLHVPAAPHVPSLREFGTLFLWRGRGTYERLLPEANHLLGCKQRVSRSVIPYEGLKQAHVLTQV